MINDNDTVYVFIFNGHYYHVNPNYDLFVIGFSRGKSPQIMRKTTVCYYYYYYYYYWWGGTESLGICSSP
jgi:hypothetical protein